MNRRLPLWFAGACLLGTAGCGDQAPPLPDTSKTVPVLPARYQRRDLEAWYALAAGAPTEERCAQLVALATLEKEPQRAVAVLLHALESEEAALQLAGVVAAGRLAPASPAVAEHLVRLLGSEEEPVRRHARLALGAFGAAALGPLGAALADERLQVRWAACFALARMGMAGEPL
ncbi:MAG: hypothetical protein O2894_09185, partial [Planctomycetota bacterium]|nr:hypothetical protein [Planctomycetota bacterium]